MSSKSFTRATLTGVLPVGFVMGTRCYARSRELPGEEIVSGDAFGEHAQLRHRPGFDLADPLTGELEVLADLFERTGFTVVETESQSDNLPFSSVEAGQQPLDLAPHELGRDHLERRLGQTILDHVGVI